MSSFFCCLRQSTEEKGDIDFGTQSPESPEAGCCCSQCLTARGSRRVQRRSKYCLRKSPQVCDAAVDTELDFGIILHNMEKGEVENLDEKDMRDYKFASLQFDSKPGKVKYIEGSQVFYVEVIDSKLNSYKRNSNRSDKSVSDEDDPHVESEASTDVMSDTKSETRRRHHETDKSPGTVNSHGKNTGCKNSGGTTSEGKNIEIIYVPSESPTTSTDKIFSRPYLREIEEDQEHPGEYSFPYKDRFKVDTKPGFNIGGGQFATSAIYTGDEDAKTLKADVRVNSLPSSESVQSGSQTGKVKLETNFNTQDCEWSEFADKSSQSVDEISHTPDLYTTTITDSKVSTDQSTFPAPSHEESLFAIDSSSQRRRSLTEDPSMLMIVEHTSSMVFVKGLDEETHKSNSCPDVTLHRSDRRNTVINYPDPSRTENGVFSVGTQTDIFEESDTIDSETDAARPYVHNVYTETEGCDIADDMDEGTARNYKEKIGIVDKTAEKDPSTSNTEGSSSQSSDSESSSGESESSSNSEGPSKKNRTFNSSDSSCSTCSSSPKSVREGEIVPYVDMSTECCDKYISPSLISSEGSSSGSSSSSTISSSSSTCSSSSTSKYTDSLEEGTSVDLQHGNG